MDNNYLQHYGVLGMKWGVRRSEAQLARANRKIDKLKAKKKEADRLDRAKKKLSNAMAEEQSLKEYLGKKSKKTNQTIDTKHKKKTLHEMSDSELKEKVARLELEKRYKDLAASTNPPKSPKGRAFVSGILENSGRNIATQLTTYMMGTAVNKLLKDIFDDSAVVNPKKGQKDK